MQKVPHPKGELNPELLLDKWVFFPLDQEGSAVSKKEVSGILNFNRLGVQGGNWEKWNFERVCFDFWTERWNKWQILGLKLIFFLLYRQKILCKYGKILWSWSKTYFRCFGSNCRIRAAPSHDIFSMNAYGFA